MNIMNPNAPKNIFWRNLHISTYICNAAHKNLKIALLTVNNQEISCRCVMIAITLITLFYFIKKKKIRTLASSLMAAEKNIFRRRRLVFTHRFTKLHFCKIYIFFSIFHHTFFTFYQRVSLDPSRSAMHWGCCFIFCHGTPIIPRGCMRYTVQLPVEKWNSIYFRVEASWRRRLPTRTMSVQDKVGIASPSPLAGSCNLFFYNNNDNRREKEAEIKRKKWK